MATNFFRGYIKTKGKQAAEPFKNRNDLKSYDEIKDSEGFAGVLSPDTILVDIDDADQSETLLDIIDSRGIKCRVYGTTRGKHFLFRNNGVDSCKTHTKIACGLTADIKVGTKNSYEVLKFNGVEREILYDILDGEEYDTVPKWLFPVKSNIDFTNMSEGDGRNQSMFNYILTLQNAGLTKDECRECLTIINDFVLEKPLGKSELEIIMRDESFNAPIFFDGKTFLFDVFSRFLIAQYNIIKINGRLHIYRDGIYSDGYNFIESEMIRHIPSLTKQKRSEVLAYIDLLIDGDTPIAPAEYIAFKNGIYNLNTDQLIAFDPSIVVTNKIDHDFIVGAYYEKTDKTLNKLACQDPEIRALLEECVGYCFFKRNELRKCFVLTGNKSNGKSTFLDLIKELLGERNCSSLDLSEFGNRFSPASLFNKLANIGDDIGDTWIDGGTAAIFKKVVSGDRIRGEFKGQTEFFFNPFCKVLLSANDIPRIGKSKSSDAIIDRLIIIPFDATFSASDPDFDPYIKYKLRTEESMQYLIQIGIAGLRRVLAVRRFSTSKKVERELSEFEKNNNPVLMFFDDIRIEDLLNQPTKDVYIQYQVFCAENNFTPMSNIEFSKQINKYFDVEIGQKRIDGKVFKVFKSKT